MAFLCEHRFLKAPVVVKTLPDDDLDRGVEVVFAEAHALRQLDHPAIIRLQDCGFASAEGDARPYLIMDFFEGTTLEECVRQKPLGVEVVLEVARQIAAGLEAAHRQGILHRDVKPANVLVRKVPARPPHPPTPSPTKGERGSRNALAPPSPPVVGEGGWGGEGATWEVRLIDFGLALRRTGRETMLASTRTILGSSIAGTLDYAAPEQMGRRPGESACPASDIYGFARTCCYALFGTPQPLPRHWRSIPAELAELLEHCLEEDPANRPQDFSAVLRILQGTAGARPSVPPAIAPLVAARTAPPGAADLDTLTVPPAAVGAEDEPRRQELALLAQKVAGCTRCTALCRTRIQTVFGSGPLSPDILFVGEAPGADEDRSGEPFVGAAGRLLDGLLREVGLDRSQVYLANLLKCRPPGNRKPEPKEVSNCREYLVSQLELIRPRSLCLLGASAVQGLLNTTESIGRMRGKLYDFKGIPVLCTYHPAFLLPGRSPERRPDVIGDLRMLLRRLGKA